MIKLLQRIYAWLKGLFIKVEKAVKKPIVLEWYVVRVKKGTRRYQVLFIEDDNTTTRVNLGRHNADSQLTAHLKALNQLT